MSELSWFEAMGVVDGHMRGGDEELMEAWLVFLRSPFPHLFGKAARDGERFVATAEHYDGRGVEHLLFRLAQAVEALPGLVGVQGPAPYLKQLVALWETVASQGAGEMGVINKVFAWAEEDAELREAILVRRRWAMKQRRNDLGPGCKPVPIVVMGKSVDEAYQRAYCDDCGMELSVDGECVNCSILEN